MSFNLGQLPFYTPKQVYAHPLLNFEIEKTPVDTWIEKHIYENSHHIKEIVFSIDHISSKVIPWCVKYEIGNIVIHEHENPIAHLCVTPCGGIHLTILPDCYSNDREKKLIEKIQPTTLSIAQPTRELWENLQQQDYLLRTEMVRWYAKVGSAHNPWEYLPSKRAKKVRYYVKKSEGYHFEVLPMTVENFSAWLPIYEQEVAERPNGFSIFYPKIFLSANKLKDMKMIHIFDNEKQLVGGAVVNTWGGFGDIGTQPRKYTSFLLQAYKKDYRNSALAYRLAEEVMSIARSYGDKIYGYGGDFNFWGETIQPGLLSHKSILGMLPHPELQVEAFRIINQKMLQSYSKQGLYILALQENHSLVQKYFKQRETDLVYNFATLYAPPYKDLDILDEVPKIWTAYHFDQKHSSSISLPQHIQCIEIN